MKILLPVDGSPCTKRMLSYIAAHDELLGTRHDYTFVTVVPPLPAQASRALDDDALRHHERSQADEVLAPAIAFAEQHRWAHDAVRRTGHAGEEIARLAEGGRYDLVVMGSHGHTAYGNALLGSVTCGVLSRCKVPVLIVR